jgi:hypothetical protein
MASHVIDGRRIRDVRAFRPLTDVARADIRLQAPLALELATQHDDIVTARSPSPQERREVVDRPAAAAAKQYHRRPGSSDTLIRPGFGGLRVLDLAVVVDGFV